MSRQIEASLAHSDIPLVLDAVRAAGENPNEVLQGHLTVTGHANVLGNAERNAELSHGRAATVGESAQHVLDGHGLHLDVSQIHIDGKGEEGSATDFVHKLQMMGVPRMDEAHAENVATQLLMNWYHHNTAPIHAWINDHHGVWNQHVFSEIVRDTVDSHMRSDWMLKVQTPDVVIHTGEHQPLPPSFPLEVPGSKNVEDGVGPWRAFEIPVDEPPQQTSGQLYRPDPLHEEPELTWGEDEPDPDPTPNPTPPIPPGPRPRPRPPVRPEIKTTTRKPVPPTPVRPEGKRPKKPAPAPDDIITPPRPPDPDPDPNPIPPPERKWKRTPLLPPLPPVVVQPPPMPLAQERPRYERTIARKGPKTITTGQFPKLGTHRASGKSRTTPL